MKAEKFTNIQGEESHGIKIKKKSLENMPLTVFRTRKEQGAQGEKTFEALGFHLPHQAN